MYNENILMRLREGRDLCKGIFWVKDVDDIYGTGLFFPINCDINGEVQNDLDYNFSSNNGRTYNHEKLWKKLSPKITDNKKYDYYPRGRVEINRGKAIIYCSPYIACDELKDWCIDKFNLTAFNGIKSIRIVSDGSSHYKCFLD